MPQEDDYSYLAQISHLGQDKLLSGGGGSSHQHGQF